jgi:lipoprotein-releasing system ATP-binding protein
MLLKLKDIVKGYGEPGSHNYRPVLQGLDLEVSKGGKVAIVGPSGSGKTTLLNLIGTLDRPEEGYILFDGNDLAGYSKSELATFRNKHLGFIFQMHHLMPQLTLMENVLLPLIAKGDGISKEQKIWAEYLIYKAGIKEQRNQKPSQLSGGECQRTAVVRALVNKPQLLLADEPTGALDEENAMAVAELLIKLSEDEGVTLISVTHASGLAARMDKEYTLKRGRLK